MSVDSPAADCCADLKVGFIGAGRMCQALGKGFIDAGIVRTENLMCSDVNAAMLDRVSKSLGIKTTTSNAEVVSESSVVVLAVKPHLVEQVCRQSVTSQPGQAASGLTAGTDHNKQTHASLVSSKLFISIAAGVTIGQIEKWLPEGSRVVRVMPNTPALVQSAASVYSKGSHATQTDEQIVSRLFSSVGYCTSLEERYLDAVTGLSGSGPAYVFMAIEALSDGGVKMGLPRDIAQQLAAHTLIGAARMVLESGEHPGALKDAVCSPGGTTITAVHHLETTGFRASLIGAVEAATNKSIALSKSSN